MRWRNGRFDRVVHISFPQTRAGPVTRDEVQLGKLTRTIPSYHATQSFDSIAGLVVAMLVELTACQIQPSRWPFTLIQETCGEIGEELHARRST
jgi:hypothetical protein